MRDPIVPDSYWVTDRFAAGEYPGAATHASASEKAARFESAGITLFVDLTHPTDRLEPYEPYLTLARRVHHPIVDNDVPSAAEMTATLDAIDDALDEGEIVYVHCWGGIGRTGLAVGCWHVRHGTSPQAAVELIRERRSATPDYRWQPDSPQTQAQHAFLRGWSARP
jgi:protein-tyrosine phosphatase